MARSLDAIGRLWDAVTQALELDFDDALTAADVERIVTRLERAIKDAHPDVSRVFIEAQSFDADRRGGTGAAAP